MLAGEYVPFKFHAAIPFVNSSGLVNGVTGWIAEEFGQKPKAKSGDEEGVRKTEFHLPITSKRIRHFPFSIQDNGRLFFVLSSYLGSYTPDASLGTQVSLVNCKLP